MNIAFFDFDGTLIKEDSFLLFINLISSKKKYFFGWFLIIFYYLFYKSGFLTQKSFKEKVLIYFMKGKDQEDIRKYAKIFAEKVIEEKLTEQAKNRLEYHENKGDRIVIVSASLDLWLQGWCKIRNYEMVSSIAEIKNGKITGKLVGENCIGSEKVNRIRKTYELDKYSKIYVYGDSDNDRPMLLLGTDAYLNWKKVL
jgi:HAD superfamily hydrolase (TIGR01490 family)